MPKSMWRCLQLDNTIQAFDLIRVFSERYLPILHGDFLVKLKIAGFLFTDKILQFLGCISCQGLTKFFKYTF